MKQRNKKREAPMAFNTYENVFLSSYLRPFAFVLWTYPLLFGIPIIIYGNMIPEPAFVVSLKTILLDIPSISDRYHDVVKLRTELGNQYLISFAAFWIIGILNGIFYSTFVLMSYRKTGDINGVDFKTFLKILFIALLTFLCVALIFIWDFDFSKKRLILGRERIFASETFVFISLLLTTILSTTIANLVVFMAKNTIFQHSIKRKLPSADDMK